MLHRIVTALIIVLFAFFPGLAKANSSWAVSGENSHLAQLSEGEKAQPGVLMLLLDDPVKPSPQPSGTLPVLDTGQTRCYNNTQEITCPESGEPFYGQDAQYQPRVPRSYSKLGEGGIELPDNASHIDDDEGPWILTRDNVTGLVWEVKNGTNKNDKYDWDDAHNDFIAGLNTEEFGGFSDWRLPSRSELFTLIERGRHHPTIDTRYFPETQPHIYWSSVVAADNNENAWRLNFSAGDVITEEKSAIHYVRGVRGNYQDTSFYEDNEDGTVTDVASGLMWQQCSYGQTWNNNDGCKDSLDRLNWKDALNYAENLIWAGYNDWRLPNINELQVLVDDTKHDPSVNILFNAQKTDTQFIYWSSTTVNYALVGAWGVNFELGDVLGSNKTNNRNVRAVRTVTD